MEKMTEKNMRKALADSNYFATLPPVNMLHVLTEDIIQNGDVKKKNFDIWLEAREKWPEITQEEKMDEVINILKLARPTKALKAFQKMGFMAFCMPRCFPIKKLMDKKSYYAIIDNFDNCKNPDLSFRLNILMFPFDPKATRMTMPSRVLMRLMPSAPAASQALAMGTMSVTLGLSLTKTGLLVTRRTAAVTSAAESGSTPKAMPPLCTLGQLTFTSMMPTLSALFIASAHVTYSSREKPLILATTGLWNNCARSLSSVLQTSSMPGF